MSVYSVRSKFEEVVGVSRVSVITRVSRQNGYRKYDLTDCLKGASAIGIMRILKYEFEL